MAYQRYPLAMSHPHHVPAVISIVHTDVSGKREGKVGAPAKFPPVFVNNEDQEKQYASQGYVPNGEPDIDAYMRATIGSHIPEDHKFPEFPKYLHCVKRNDKGEEIAVSELVNNKAEQDKRGPQWHKTPDEAKAWFDAHDRGQKALDDAMKSQGNADAENEATPAAKPKNKGGRPRKAVQPSA